MDIGRAVGLPTHLVQQLDVGTAACMSNIYFQESMTRLTLIRFYILITFCCAIIHMLSNEMVLRVSCKCNLDR